MANNAGLVTVHSKGFSSICPFDKLVDEGTIAISYLLGDRLVDNAKLRHFLSSFQDVEIPLELVPIEIAKWVIEECVNIPPPSKWAAPERIDIKTRFQAGSKKWGMIVKLTFEREIILSND